MSEPLIVVCGLRAEERIARAPGIRVLVAGGDQARLRADLERSAPTARAVLSFGIAGGLLRELAPGTIRVANAVVSPLGERFPTHPGWAGAIARGLGINAVLFAGVDQPVTSLAEKASLHALTGADLVDMESHIAAAVATAHGLPFAALRAVTDPADRALPHAAAVAMQPDGSVSLPAVLRSLARDPRQIPLLVRTGLDSRRAFGALLRGRQRLGPAFALGDLV